MGILTLLLWIIYPLHVVVSAKSSSYVKPNILFIMADDLGYRDLGYKNNKDLENATPNIDKLAEQGVVLQRHYVMPQCSPTRASFLTGKHPIEIGAWYGNQKPSENGGLDLEHRTMADMLKEYGYQTHIVGKWHLGMSGVEYTPTRRGFDTFLGMYLGSGKYFKHTNNGGYDLRLNFRDEKGVVIDNALTNYNNVYSTEIFTNRTLDLLEDHHKRHSPNNTPFFIFLSHQAPHGPYEAPDSCRTRMGKKSARNNKQKYAAMIHCMDRGIGRITEKLGSLNLLDNTLIVFSSDNGATLDGPGSNYPLRGGKKTYYEGGIRAASFVSSPLLAKTGYVNKNLHHVSDWYPTFEYLASGEVAKKRKRRKKKRGVSASGVNIWHSISEGEVVRNTVLINIQRRDKYYPVDRTGESNMRHRADSIFNNMSENLGFLTIIPEDGTELIDEDENENENENENESESEEQPTELIDEDNEVFEFHNSSLLAENDENMNKVPFKTLVVFIWGSWKLIIGNEESLYAGWNDYEHKTIVHTAEYTTGKLDDTDKVVFLYELKSDPREERNIAAKYPKMVHHMIEQVSKQYWSNVVRIRKSKTTTKGIKNGVWRCWLNPRDNQIEFRTDHDIL